MKVRGALLLVSLVIMGIIASLAPLARADTRKWSGKDNNNWDHGGNWDNGGVPNSSTENAAFDSTGANRQIDLRGGSYKVDNLTFDLSNGKNYEFASNQNGVGKISIYGGMSVTAASAETIFFHSEAHIEQVVAGTWSNSGGVVTINSKLIGTVGLTLSGNFTFSSADNSYSGLLKIQSGTTTIDAPNAFQFATVELDGNDGLNITADAGVANLAAFQGYGDFNLGGQTLKFGFYNASTSYSGVISGGGTIGKFGTGTWTIGAPNMFSGLLDVQGGKVKLIENESGSGQSTALTDATVQLDVHNGLDVNGYNTTLGALTGTGNLNLGATTLTVGANNASTAYSGVISGSSGSLVKTGTGNFTLSGASTYSGNTTIQGGSLSISAANNLGNGSELRLDHGTLITNGSFTLNRNISQSNLNGTSSTIQVNSSGNTVAVNGGISGIANLTLHKTGDGGLRLNQSGTYAGEVEIDAGAIIIGDTNALKNATMHVNVNDGIDMVDGGVDATFAGLTGSGNINNGGHTITINGNFNETYSGILSGSGGLTKLGMGDLTLSAANTFGGDTNIGSDNLIDGKVILGNANALKNSTVYINTDNRLDINGFNANLGALGGSGNLKLGTTSLMAGGNGATTTYSGTISGDVGGNATLRKVGAGTLTVTGTVNNLYELWASNNGQLTLSGADVTLLQISDDDYHSPGATNGAEVVISNGSTVVSMGSIAHSDAQKNGTLRITDPGTSLTTANLGASTQSGSVWVQNGALATVTNVFYAGAFSIPANAIGSVTVESGGRVEGSADGLFGQDPGDEGTLTITGAGSTVKLNELRLGGKTTSPGGTGTATVKNGGALTVNGAIKLWTTASSLTVDGGACSVDTLFNDTGATPTINLSDANSSSPALTVGVSGGNSTFDGLIKDAAGGPGSLAKIGTGTLTLAHANTYSGGTTIDGGQVILANANALQNSTVSINVDGGLDVTTNAINANIGGLAGAGDLNLGPQTLTTGSNGASTTYSGVLGGSSDSQLSKKGTGTLTLTGGTGAAPSSFDSLHTTSGPLMVDGAHVKLNSVSQGAGDLALGASSGGDITLIHGAVVQGDTTAGIGLVENATLTVTGDGTSLTLFNLFTGLFAADTGTISVANQAKVTLAGGLIVGRSGAAHVTVQSGAQLAADSIHLANYSENDSTALFTGANTSATINHLDIGSRTGSGSGAITVADGADVKDANDTIFRNEGTTLTINGGTFSTDTLSNLSGGAPVISISDPTGGTALTIGTNNGSTTWAGLIQDAAGGPGSIMKTGTGTFTLSGANTFTGGVTVAGGTLLASNTAGSATGTSTVTVKSGATIGGTGSAAGLTTVVSGGTVAPGASAGVLTLGNVTFDAGSKLAIQIGGTSPGSGHDQLVVNNTATLGGTLDLAYIDPFTTTPGQSFVILTAGTLTGTFDAVNYPDGQNWSITYDTDAGTVTVGICADSDGDGVCDDDDLCPGTPSGALVDANGCAIPAPTILGWTSVRTHGNNVGDLAIDLNANGSRLPTTEPRRDGIRKIVVTFSEAVAAADGTLDTNDVVVFGFDNGAQVPTSLSLDGGATGTVLTINFANGLPDDEIYGFNLAGKFKSAATALPLDGDTDAEVANYEGDARDTAPSTESIDILDLQAIKIAILGGAAPTARTDLNPDGQLNIIDMVMVKRNLGNAFPAP